MNVICTDGTRFRCDRYELTEKGVKLYCGDVDEPPARYESDADDHQVGFVPDERLLYILPEGVSPAGAPVTERRQAAGPVPRRQPNR